LPTIATARLNKAICHSYYLLFGLVGVGLLPPLVKSFEDSYGISHTTMGIVLGVGAVVLALASLGVGVWYDRRGGRAALSATMLLCAVSALGIYFTRSVVAFVALLLAFHLANGLGSVVSPLVAKLYAEERTRGMNLLHAFQGVGRLLAPMLVAACIALSGQWRAAFVVSAVLFGIWFPLVWFGLKETPQVRSRQHHDTSFGAIAALHDRVVMLGVAGFFVLSGCEMTLMTWLPNFLESETQFGKTEALTALTAMMLGYTAIRIVLGLRRSRVTSLHIALSAIVLAAAFSLATKVSDQYLLYCLAFLMGLCFGPYWPSLAAAIYDYIPWGHGTLTGLFGIGSTTGAFVFVSAVGVLGDIVSLRYGLLIAPVCGILFAIAYYACEVLARRNRPRIAPGRDV